MPKPKKMTKKIIYRYNGKVRRIEIEGKNKVYIYLVVDKSLVTKRGNQVYIPLVDASNNTPPVVQIFEVFQDEDSDNYLIKLEDDNGLFDKIICIIDRAQSIYVEIEKVRKRNIIRKIKLNF